MVEYIIKRLILAFFTLLAILLVSYVLLRLAPGDPTRSSMFGSDSAGSALDGAPAPSAGCSPHFSDSDVKLSLRNQSYSSG